MNSVSLIGNLTADPELRHTTNGTSVADCTIAVNTGTGERKETAFIGITVWGAAAEALCKYKTKGDPIAVGGRITQDSWEDKSSGEKRQRTKVTAQHVEFLSRAPKRDPQPSDPNRPF